MASGEWKYIRHYKDHIILSLGDSMEFLTGGVLKAAPHRGNYRLFEYASNLHSSTHVFFVVKEPPEDQRLYVICRRCVEMDINIR